jgi:hypothetical protein
MVGVCCPDDINSVAAGVTLTLENIKQHYKNYIPLKVVPNLPDHGVPFHNVWDRICFEDFKEFYEQVCEAADIARQALDSDKKHESAELWGKLFGTKFPKPPSEEGFTERNALTAITGGRFAF